MKVAAFLFLFLLTLHGQDNIKQDVDLFLKQLDGNYKERKIASNKLNNLPVDFYPFLEEHLQSGNPSMEVKLRLTKEKMFPLRAKWLHQQRLDWYRKNLFEAYEKYGEKNAKWDNDVRKVFELVLKEFNEYWYISHYSNQIAEASQRALDNGCKDPLIYYFLARGNRIKLGTNFKKLRALHQQAYDALLSSNYHAYFKFRSTRLLAYYLKVKQNSRKKPSTKDYERSAAKMAESLKYLKVCLKDKNFPFVEFYHNINQYLSVSVRPGVTVMDALETLKPVIVEAFGSDSMQVITVEGIATRIFGDKVRKKNYREGRALQREAIEVLSRAWEKDPACVDTAVLLMKTSIELVERSLVEKWYQNILLADPNNRDAFNDKANFVRAHGTVEELWQFADQVIAKGGIMLKHLPNLMYDIGNKIASNTPELFFDFDGLYQNNRVISYFDKGFTKYMAEFPNDHNARFNYAYYIAKAGAWKQAYQLFQKAGDLSTYNGSIELVLLKEMELEAKLYVQKQIKAPTVHFYNYEQKHKNRYAAIKATGNYDFWKMYQSQNPPDERWDKQVKEALEAYAKDWTGEGYFNRDVIANILEPYRKLSKVISAGNNDPLIHMVWSTIKDNWYMEGGDKSEHFLAAQRILESNYPSSIKISAICHGIYSLSKQKLVSDSEKFIAKGMAGTLVDLVDESYMRLTYYSGLFKGLKDLKLFDQVKLESIIEKYRSIGKTTEAYIIEGFFNNTMAWHTHGLTKKKNWQVINKYNLQAKEAMKNAWLQDPLHPLANEFLYRYSTRKHKDYYINLRRALYSSPKSSSLLMYFLQGDHNDCSRTKKWMKYPYLSSKVSLLHYEHAEGNAKSNKGDKTIRKDHWINVKKSFDLYLSKFPNDVISRSKFANYAILTGQEEEAKEQLKILGENALPNIFGGQQKLLKYQKEYLRQE